MDSIDFAPVWLTVKLATITTLILILLGTPLAWWLAQSRSAVKTILGAIIALPLVLPPTVLGFYLLVFMGSNGALGKLTDYWGLERLAFTFSGLVIGSVFYSMPFVVQPIQNAFEAISARQMEIAATLRASPIDRFFTVALPIARPGIATAAVLGFAHTVGEFGVVLMLGGNIPGRTRLLSVAIYDHVESLEYTQAHILAGGMLVFSFFILLWIYSNRRFVRIGV